VVIMEQPTASSVLESEPTAADDGVIIPTEIYSLPDSQASISSEEFQKALPGAFESLSNTTTVRLGIDHDEEQLFDTLINTTEAYERGEITLDDDEADGDGDAAMNDADNTSSSKASDALPRPLEVRVAGGWVRDKILGLPSHDVDITLDNLMGLSFARLIQKYLLSLPLSHPARCQTKYPKIGVIAANPAASKHLETATMKVHRIDIDICHLRADEIYDENSRIPRVQMGTPFQDAQRRDFTINSLFYNLKTKQVEDWTRRGLQDLRERRLVTPVDAGVTFEDDPLRVLRAIRFAVRYQLKLDDELKSVAMNPKIHKALQVKVSRERVGKELEGMLTGKGANPQRALATISQLNLAGCVFCFPTTGEVMNSTQITSHPHGEIMGHNYHGDHDSMSHLREMGWEEAQQLLEYLPKVHQLHRELPKTASLLDERLFPLAAFLLPFRRLLYEERKKGNIQNSTGKQLGVTTFMFREGIKFKTKDTQDIAKIMNNVDPMATFLADLAEQHPLKTDGANETLKICRLEAGLVIRETKELWVTTLLLACIVKMREQDLSMASSDAVDWIKLTASAYKTILSLNLEECWKTKPLLNGKAVIAALNLPRGPEVSSYLEEQARWMLLNPDGTPEQVEQHLHSIKRQREAEGSNGDSCQPASQHPRLK